MKIEKVGNKSMQDAPSTEMPLTRYHIIGREVVTRRRIEVSDWEAPDVETAKQLAREIGVEVLEITPMENRPPEDHGVANSLHVGGDAEEDVVGAGAF